MEGTERRPPGKESHREAATGRKYCSTASHAARNGEQREKGLISLCLDHPDTSRECLG